MLTSVIAFIVAFGILVLVHEFGHFWVARKVGIAVEKFSIGFGPKIFGFRWRETDFCVSMIPLGGFVKMRGEEESSEIPPNDPTSFSNKPVAARACVVLAGPMMNLLLSFVLMPVVFWLGKPEATFLKQPPVVERILPGSPAEKSDLLIGDRILSLNEKETPTWESFLEPLVLTSVGQQVTLKIQRGEQKKNILLETASLPSGEGTYLGFEKFFGKAPEAVVKSVAPSSPAKQAGIQIGDRIIKIGNTSVRDWDHLIREVNAHSGEPLSITVSRNRAEHSFQVQPQWNEDSKRWLLGIQGPETKAMGLIQLRRYGFWEGIQTGFKTNVKNMILTFQVLKKLVTLQLSYKSLGGPVQIAYTLAKASAAGISDFLYFTAFLSLQLAILNLLPIPMLDGGHLLFYIIEAIRRKPLSLKVRLISQQVGLVLLLTLIFFVTLNDLERLLGISQWLERFLK